MEPCHALFEILHGEVVEDGFPNAVSCVDQFGV